MTDNLPATIEPKEVNSQVQDDLVDVRNNVRDIIKQTAEAALAVADLADTSQSARYYEVLNGLLKTSIEANRELVDIHKKKQEIMKSSSGPRTQVNNLIMTSNEMLKIIKGETTE